MRLATFALAIMFSALVFADGVLDVPDDVAADPSAAPPPDYVNRYRTPRPRYARSRTPLAASVPAARAAAPAAETAEPPAPPSGGDGDCDSPAAEQTPYEKRLCERSRDIARQRETDEARKESAVAERDELDNTADDELSQRRYDWLDALGN